MKTTKIYLPKGPIKKPTQEEILRIAEHQSKVK